MLTHGASLGIVVAVRRGSVARRMTRWRGTGIDAGRVRHVVPVRFIMCLDNCFFDDLLVLRDDIVMVVNMGRAAARAHADENEAAKKGAESCNDDENGTRRAHDKTVVATIAPTVTMSSVDAETKVHATAVPTITTAIAAPSDSGSSKGTSSSATITRPSLLQGIW